MYFKKSNSFFHGVMFHHFHDEVVHTTKGQGSISKDDLNKIVKFIGRKNILNADTFFEKFKKNKLKKTEVCLTFDDGIKCQMDVALPVLEDLKIKSFFFVYTSLFEGKPDNLEIFRYFRMNYFKSIDQFYLDFYKMLKKNVANFFETNKEYIASLKIKYSHFSNEDIKFRLIRDIFLKKNEYEEIMFSMMSEKDFQPKKFYSHLFFDKKDLIKLDKLGHLVGLHSHTHPTYLEKLNYNDQKNEYEKCISVISSTLKKPKSEIRFMSHPCGSYNKDTLKILKELGVELGFKHTLTIDHDQGMKKINNSSLEIARINHSDIMKEI